MHNFGITSQLKTWFDTVVRAGKTFRYSEQGPEGLLKGKRAIVVETRGGIYTTGPAASFNHQESHLKRLLGFIGVADVQFIRAEGLDMGPESRANGLAHAKNAIEQLLDSCVAQAA
jgi:FMN-dependent NADH-azoreductase